MVKLHRNRLFQHEITKLKLLLSHSQLMINFKYVLLQENKNLDNNNGF